jgi:excisionase family DNA binding protein
MAETQIAEVAKILKLSESQVYAIISSGELKCHRFTTGKQGGIRISRRQLEEYLASTVVVPHEDEEETSLRHLH